MTLNINISGPPSISLSANNSSTSNGLGGEYAPANNLGYGVGGIVRGAFNTLTNAWQKMWVPKSSITKQAQPFPNLERAQTKRALLQTNNWPASFDLATLDGTNGFMVPGLAMGGMLGYSVSTTGDFNGDGRDDLILGAPGISSDTGAAYVLFGQAYGSSASFNLTTLNGTNGFVVPGIVTSYLGYSVSPAGDINGDGKDDLVLGAYGVSSYRGAVYVIFGQAAGRPASFNLGALNGTNGFVVPGIAANGYLGWAVSTAGDFNGDGKNDLVLVGANLGAYLLFGQGSGWPASFNLATLNGANGFAIPSISNRSIISVSNAGDINSDGKDDLVLGDFDSSSTNGTVYVLFGQTDGWPASFNLTALNGTNGFAIPGLESNDRLGDSVSTAGDLNGDGIVDLVLGAPYVSSVAGTAYVLFGLAGGWPAIFNLAALNGTNGFVVPGIVSGDDLGQSVSAVGDLNGDGKDDLVLGAFGASLRRGAVFVLFGQAGVWQPSFNLTALNGANGFKVEELAAGDWLGFSVSTAGDFNGDGTADLVLGASNSSPSGRTSAGIAYVIFGKNTSLLTPTPIPTPVEIPTPMSSSLLPVTIDVNIPPNLNTTFIPLTSDILAISNNTVAISLIETKGYAIVFSTNSSAVPLFGNFTPIEISGLSIARGNASLSDEPIFQACRVDGQCSFSNKTAPLQQVFTVQGVDWKIIVPVVVGVAAVALGGGLIFYFTYYKKHQKTPNEKEMPLPDAVANPDTATQRRDTQPKENYLQIASAYQDGSY